MGFGWRNHFPALWFSIPGGTKPLGDILPYLKLQGDRNLGQKGNAWGPDH